MPLSHETDQLFNTLATAGSGIPGWDAAVNTLKGLVNGAASVDRAIKDFLNGFNPASPPAAQGIDPAQALNDLAAAIASAERKLNDQNLLIFRGTVDASMKVDVGGVAGADAQIHLEIAPKA